MDVTDEAAMTQIPDNSQDVVIDKGLYTDPSCSLLTY